MKATVCTLAALAFALAACNPPQVSKRPPLPVTLTVAKVATYAPTLQLTGEIAARVSSNLSFRISGRVIERKADVGQHVQAGDILARLDPATAQADVDAANAAVASAEAVVKQSQTAFDRQKQLFDQGFATRSAFDSAQQALRTAQGSLDGAKAQAATAADALNYSNLKTEKSGIITQRNIEVGQVAQAAQTAFVLAEDGPRDAVFNVFESIFFSRPAAGGIKLALISDPKITAHGVVREVSPTVNTAAGTVKVKVGVDANADAMPLGAAVIGQGGFAPRDVVELPWTAAASDGGALAVWLYDSASGAVRLQRVTAEAFDNNRLILNGGLKGGEQVVTSGAKFLYPGEVVAPQETP